MAIRKEPNTEPLPGYRLVERLGHGGCGEVWKCEAPGGFFKAIKFVYGNLQNIDGHRAAAQEELRAIEHIKSIRHPFLLSMDRVECVDGELVIVTELADRTLHQVLEECQRAGQLGLPRRQLLDYLREAAEVLDLLHLGHGLQHLDVKPQNLFVVWNHIKVGDFGLVNRLAESADGGGAKLGAITPLYAAPELFQGRISPHCDQYSLAITYQELLTGTVPFRGKSSRELLMLHTTAEPNLEPLPPEDRPIVARALAKDPGQRFPSCLDLVRALTDCGLRTADGGLVNRSDPPHDLPSDPTIPDPISARSNPPPAVRMPHLALLETVSDLSLSQTTVALPQQESVRPATATAGQYRLLELLGTTPLMETWRVAGPDGRPRLLKYLFGFGGTRPQQEEALRQLRSLHHPVLAPAEVVESTPGRITVVTDLAERNLRDYLQQCRLRKLPGIPQAELLDLLHPVAEGLDYLYRQHSVQHLGLHPGNLWLQQGQLLVDEFGLVQLLWLTDAQLLSRRHGRYAAPELLRGQVSPTCDQYSLALICWEMLTGKMAPVTPGDATPDLPAADREALARALHPDPRQRWPNCTALITALQGKAAHGPRISDFAADQFTALVQTAASLEDRGSRIEDRGPRIEDRGSRIEDRTSLDSMTNTVSAGALRDVLTQLIRSAGGETPAADEQPPAVSEDGRTLHHKFTAGLPLGAARLKLDSVREQAYGELVRDTNQGYVFHVDVAANLWQQLTGKQPGLEVAVTLNRQHPLAPTPIEVTVAVTACHCARKRGRQLLEDVGLSLLEQVRSALLVNSEKRIQDRLLWPHPVEVRPVYPDGTIGEVVECRGKDLSLGGIGFYLPHQLDTSEVLIRLTAPGQDQPVDLPAALVRAKPCADGWYDVGALFRLAALRQRVQEALSA